MPFSRGYYLRAERRAGAGQPRTLDALATATHEPGLVEEGARLSAHLYAQDAATAAAWSPERLLRALSRARRALAARPAPPALSPLNPR